MYLFKILGLFVLRLSIWHFEKFDDVKSQNLHVPAKATMFKFGYLMKYCIYFPYIFLVERMEVTLF